MRSTTFISVLLSSLVMLIPNVVSAHWQYTTWGMTPDEVVASSGGAATQNHNPDLNSDDLTTRLVAPYRAGNFGFRCKITLLASVALFATATAANAQEQCAGYVGQTVAPKSFDGIVTLNGVGHRIHRL